MTFVLAVSQPTPYGGGLRGLTFYDYMIHLIIDLKLVINVMENWRISALLLELEVIR